MSTLHGIGKFKGKVLIHAIRERRIQLKWKMREMDEKEFPTVY